MKQVIFLFIFASLLSISCRRWGNKCGTCPDHDRSDYLKKERKAR